MSTLRSLLPAVGAGIALTAGPGQEIAFRPEPGASVTKTFVISGAYELDELGVVVNGQDLAGMMPAIEMSLKQSTKIEVTDVYRAVENGRLLELARSFDALTVSVDMHVSPAPEGEMPGMDSASDLEGRTVVFHWNEEKGEYVPAFEGEASEGDAEMLEGLEEDMDLRVFLPEGEVEVGETWTVPLSELGSVIMPGGNLALRPTDMAADEGAMEKFEELFGDFGERFADMLEGDCTCTFKGTRKEDGKEVAEIALEVGIATTLDLSEMLDELIRTAIAESGVPEVPEFDIEGADLVLDFDGEGTLLWSLTAGRAHGFSLSGDATLGMDLVVGFEVEGERQDIDASIEFSGTMSHELVTSD